MGDLRNTSFIVAVVCGGAFSVGGGACGRCTPGPTRSTRVATNSAGQTVADARLRPSSSLEPPREPGPRRRESREQLTRERQRVDQFFSAMRGAGISPREITSMADIRGFRLYRRRFFGRARLWFEEAVRTDPTFELSLYNAARVAALLGDHQAARAHLARLARLDTPLSRQRLDRARRDPDLKHQPRSELKKE